MVLLKSLNLFYLGNAKIIEFNKRTKIIEFNKRTLTKNDLKTFAQQIDTMAWLHIFLFKFL